MIHVCRSAPPELEDLFGGRWDPKRSIHENARLLVAVVAQAVQAAGWWRPGSGAEVSGGLIVARERVGPARARRFERTGSPGEFLFALPSSAAAAVGLALGLLDYQATLCGAPELALRHAAELVDTGRLARVVAASLEADRALAACIDRTTPVAPLLSRWSAVP